MSHRIYTNYKCVKTCLTGYTQNMSEAVPKCCTTCYTGSTQITSGMCPLYIPSQKAVGNRFSYLTGSTQTTIEPCPLHFLTIRQLVTDSNNSQDIE